MNFLRKVEKDLVTLLLTSIHAIKGSLRNHGLLSIAVITKLITTYMSSKHPNKMRVVECKNKTHEEIPLEMLIVSVLPGNF